jgi:hypothetical protein
MKKLKSYEFEENTSLKIKNPLEFSKGKVSLSASLYQLYYIPNI